MSSRLSSLRRSSPPPPHDVATHPCLQEVPLVVPQYLAMPLDGVEHRGRGRLLWVVERFRKLLDCLGKLKGGRKEEGGSRGSDSLR